MHSNKNFPFTDSLYGNGINRRQTVPHSHENSHKEKFPPIKTADDRASSGKKQSIVKNIPNKSNIHVNKSFISVFDEAQQKQSEKFISASDQLSTDVSTLPNWQNKSGLNGGAMVPGASSANIPAPINNGKTVGGGTVFEHQNASNYEHSSGDKSKESVDSTLVGENSTGKDGDHSGLVAVADAIGSPSNINKKDNAEMCMEREPIESNLRSKGSIADEKNMKGLPLTEIRIIGTVLDTQQAISLEMVGVTTLIRNDKEKSPKLTAVRNAQENRDSSFEWSDVI